MDATDFPLRLSPQAKARAAVAQYCVVGIGWKMQGTPAGVVGKPVRLRLPLFRREGKGQARRGATGNLERCQKGQSCPQHSPASRGLVSRTPAVAQLSQSPGAHFPGMEVWVLARFRLRAYGWWKGGPSQATVHEAEAQGDCRVQAWV